MKTTRVFMVEGDLDDSQQLKELLEEVLPEASVVGTAHGVKRAIQWLRKNNNPDLIFANIELPDGESFEIFQNVSTLTPVIFTSSFGEGLVRAFKVNCVDCLLKPVKRQDLMEAIEKWRLRPLLFSRQPAKSSLGEMLHEVMHMGETAYRTRFLVRIGKKTLPVKVDDIMLFFNRQSHTYCYTKTNQKYLLGYSLDQVEQMLNPSDYFRVNRNFILPKSVISSLIPFSNRSIKVEIKFPFPEDIFVSKDKSTLIKAWLGA